MSDCDIIYNFFIALLKNDTQNIINNHKLIIERKLDLEFKEDLNNFLSKVIYESIRVGSIEPIKFIAENYQHCVLFAVYDLEYAYSLDRTDIIKYLIENKLVLIEDIEYTHGFIIEGFSERTSVETIKYLISVGFVIEDFEEIFEECVKFKKINIYKFLYSEYSSKIRLNYYMLLKIVLNKDEDNDLESLKWLIEIFNINTRIKLDTFYNAFDGIKTTSFMLDKFEYLFKECPNIISILIKTYYIDLLNLFNLVNEGLDLINRPHLRQFIYKLKDKFCSTRFARDEGFVFHNINKELEMFEAYKDMVKKVVSNFVDIHQDVVKYVLMKYI